MQVNSRSPVRFTGKIDIVTPIEKVWAIMSDIEKWPEWNHDISSAKLLGKLEPGTSFVWKAGPSTITSLIKEVTPNKTMSWTGKTMGIRATHIWRLEQNGNGTRVTTEESWDGLVAKITKPLSQRTLEKSIKSGLKMLKDFSESIYNVNQNEEK